jgi:hypothetical protein
MRFRLTALVAWVASTALGMADASALSGTVSSRGVPLAGVAVVAEIDGVRAADATTDEQGRFAVVLGGAAGARDFLVAFSHPGFRPDTRLLDRAALELPLNVSLLPATGPGALSPADQEALRPLVTPAGTGPLMFVPYRLQTGSGRPDPASFNERLRIQLQRLIITHVQSAAPAVDVRGIALTQAPIAIDDDLERLRSAGEFVNALAVVSGIGIGEGSGTPSIELASNYLIIPRGDLFVAPVLSIVDTVPAEKIGLAAIDPKMSRMWGRATILALAAQDLNDAQAKSGEARRVALKRVQQYLVAERSNIGAKDTLGDSKLKELLDVVARELRR